MEAVFFHTMDQVLAQVKNAGGAFLAIRDGEVVQRECFGTADMETGRPVTEQTIFDIASDTKAITTTLIATFCDEGVLDWDKPVRTWWKDFTLGGDEYVSAHITLRDMASHRSGLTSHNLLRRSLPEDLPDRKAYVERIQKLPLSDEFRYRFHYQNELYAAMGYLLEMLTGKTYEQLVYARIVEPLGMDFAFRSFPTDYPDIAMPHLAGFGTLKKTTHDGFGLNNPCGGGRTNLKSMEKWLRCLIAGGRLPDGTPLISPAQFKQLCTPNSYWSDPSAPDHQRCYGLGLAPSVYRGEHLVYHGGSIRGFRSAVGFFPERNSGYAVMINSTCQPLAVLKYLLCDAALGCLKDDYSALTDRMLESFRKKEAESASLPKNRLPQAELETRAGVYWNDAYHKISAAPNGDGGLTLRYGIDRAELYATKPGVMEGFFCNSGIHADCRFAPDGQNAVMSLCSPYTPIPFRKL